MYILENILTHFYYLKSWNYFIAAYNDFTQICRTKCSNFGVILIEKYFVENLNNWGGNFTLFLTPAKFSQLDSTLLEPKYRIELRLGKTNFFVGIYFIQMRHNFRYLKVPPPQNKQNKTRSTMTKESQLSKNPKIPTDNDDFHSCNRQKRLPYKILGGKNVQIDL